jgi:hypothetical protein
MFLDKEVAIDIDKVVIEMPTEEVAPVLELKAGETAPTSAEAADKAAEEEQKKLDELFKK